jgi:D-alanine transaminase
VLREVARRNRVTEGLLYMQITRGVARRDHAFPTHPIPPAIVVTVRRSAPYPRDLAAWATTAVTHPDQRWARCDIKSVSLLPNVLAKQAAREKGAAEAILISADGTVTEGASTNVWIVDAAGVLRTRPLSHSILPGCTRAALLALLDEEDMTLEERPFTEAELRQAQEAFITSATSFVRPITAIDGEKVGDGAVGPVSRRLFAMFTRHVEGGLPNAA